MVQTDFEVPFETYFIISGNLGSKKIQSVILAASSLEIYHHWTNMGMFAFS
jgi:hypothetical protein